MSLSPQHSQFTEFIQATVQTQSEYKTYLKRRLKRENVDLSYETFQILVILWNQDGVNQQELADALHKDKATLTYLLDNLCKREFVIRTEDPCDRRNKLIRLTEKGKDTRDIVFPVMEELLGMAAKNVTPQEVEVALRLYQKIHENLQELERS